MMIVMMMFSDYVEKHEKKISSDKKSIVEKFETVRYNSLQTNVKNTKPFLCCVFFLLRPPLDSQESGTIVYTLIKIYT